MSSRSWSDRWIEPRSPPLPIESEAITPALREAAIASGLLFLGIVGLIPLLGPPTVTLATAVGLGALTLQVRSITQPVTD